MLQTKCRSSYLNLEEKSFGKVFDNLSGMYQRNSQKRASVVFDYLLVKKKNNAGVNGLAKEGQEHHIILRDEATFWRSLVWAKDDTTV